MDPELNEIGKQQAVVVRYTLAQNLLFFFINKLAQNFEAEPPICGFMVLPALVV
jgi:hypothetical protein